MEARMTAPATRGRFLWHELVTGDPTAAIAFYSAVVDWRTEAWDTMPDYIMWVGERGPVGGLHPLPEPGTPPHWLGYIGTTDANATMLSAVRLGGRVLKPMESVPTVGRMVLLADPQGAVFSAFQPESPMPDDGTMRLGDFTWHELATSDPEAAFRFYQELFGWEKTSAMDMGPMGVYQMFGWDGKSMGGIYRIPPDMPAPPHWLPYAHVRDAAASAKLTTKRGGKVIHGPMEVPGGDWITMAIDPQGAEFAVHSKAPARAARTAKPAKKKAAKKTAVRKAAKKKAAKRKAAKKTAAKKKPAARKRAAPRKKAAGRKKR
jgi:predicted enzyme related to lactoylglutathione lyase